MIIDVLRWIAVLFFAFVAGKLMTKIKMPSILGWLIVGMILGPHAIKLMPQSVLNANWYKTIIMWMQCAFGVMLGSELIWNKLKTSGKSLIITTLTQSLGTFAIVSLAFGIVFYFTNVPVLVTPLSITSNATPLATRFSIVTKELIFKISKTECL